jgi:hypothetical protein
VKSLPKLAGLTFCGVRIVSSRFAVSVSFWPSGRRVDFVG